jgi:hypothetical protein
VLLLDRHALNEASLPDLQETYQAVKGAELPTADIAVARVKVGMALLFMEYAVGWLGVPKGVSPKAITINQLIMRGKMENKEQTVDEILAQIKPGTMAYQLLQATKAKEAIVPKPPKPRNTEPRIRIAAVKATFKGLSKPQEGSLRNKVLLHIQLAKGSVNIDTMETALGFPVRGHIQKLLEKQHIEVTEHTQE